MITQKVLEKNYKCHELKNSDVCYIKNIFRQHYR